MGATGKLLVLVVTLGVAAGGVRAACEDVDPSWSPDGAWIAFVSNCDGNMEVYRMRPDGSERTRLTRTPGAEHTPRWSPGGGRIAYAYDPEDGRSDIMIMAADGSGARRLTRTETSEWSPTWSPDGRRVAYERHRDGNAEVYAFELATGAETRLTRSPARDVAPAWSPDGALVAFQSDRGGRYAIHGVGPDGSAAPRVLVALEGAAVTPAWSPDGTRLAFAFQPEGEADTELYLAARDGGAPVRLTRDERIQFSPAWSPDGRRLAFMTRSGEAPWSIGVMDAEGVGGGAGARSGIPEGSRKPH